MTPLGTLLAVAVFTGSLASVRSDEQNSLFTQLQEGIVGYMETVQSGMEDKVNWVLSLNTTKELHSQIVVDYSKANQYLEKLHSKLPTEVTGPVHNLISQVFGIALDIIFKIDSMQEKLYPTLRSVLAHYADPVLEKVQGPVEALSARIQELSKKTKEETALQLEHLKTREMQLASYIKEAHNQWQEFQKSLEPTADWVQEHFQLSVETLNTSLKPYVAAIREVLGEEVR